MKRLILISLSLFAGIVQGQFKDQDTKPVNVLNGIVTNSPSSFLLGFINPDNLQLNHSVDMSFTTFGNHSVALGVYTGSLSYKFSDNLDMQVDASIVNSPYNSFGEDYSNSINGVYLNRAQLNYRPSENMVISVQFSQMPYGYYQPYYRNYLFDRNPSGLRSSFDK